MLAENWEPSEAIRRVLRNATELDPAGPEEFGSAARLSGSTLRQMLALLVRRGWATRIRKGVYVKGPKFNDVK